jgi:anti-sigma regulatory factor (Ser/Thr protein kinase)
MIESDDAVTLRLPAQARFIRLARLVGAGLANDLGIDLDGLDDVRLAIGEVCGLATQFGASELELKYSVDGQQLLVRGRGQGHDSDTPVPGDDEQLRLVRQILGVASAAHELNVREDGLAFSLTFANGR